MAVALVPGRWLMDQILPTGIRSRDGWIGSAPTMFAPPMAISPSWRVVAIATLLARFSVVAEPAEIPLLTQITLPTRRSGVVPTRAPVRSASALMSIRP